MIDERQEMSNPGLDTLVNNLEVPSLSSQTQLFINSYNAHQILNRYEFLETIGHGSYGMVMKARRKPENKEKSNPSDLFAVKMIKAQFFNENEGSESEVGLLRELVTKNLIKEPPKHC